MTPQEHFTYRYEHAKEDLKELAAANPHREVFQYALDAIEYKYTHHWHPVSEKPSYTLCLGFSIDNGYVIAIYDPASEKFCDMHRNPVKIQFWQEIECPLDSEEITGGPKTL